MKSPLSIALQIVLAVILTVVAVLGISSIIELNILQRRETQQLQERGKVSADRIANSLAYPLSNQTQAETERVVIDELLAREVSSIQVFDEHGQLYLGKVKTSTGAIQDANNVNAGSTTPGNSSAFSYTRDIHFKNNRIGSVKLDVSSAYLQPELTKLRWGIAIKLLLLVVLLSVVLLVALRVLVLSRLSALKSWVQRSPASGLPPQFRQSDEFNSLADAFGRMSAHLRSKHEELEREHEKLLELNSQLQEKIAEREQAEAGIRESEERFAQITENISEVLWLSTHDYSQILYVSPSYEKVWGKTTASLYENPHSYLDSVHPEDREFVKARIKADRELGFSLEYRIQMPDGSIRWIWDRGFPIRNDKGNIHRIVGISEDITERKQALESFRRYADRVRDLYNNAPCGYHSLDENGVYVQINDTELSWLGRLRDDVVGKVRFKDVLRSEDHALFDEKYRQFVNDGSIRDVEYQLVSKDGTSRTVLLSATASKNPEGKFVMSRATLYDITDRRRAEELVKRSEEKFARAFRSSPVGMVVTRIGDERIIEINQAALAFLEYESHEVIGKTTLELGLWQDRNIRGKLLVEIETEGAIHGREILFRSRQGKTLTCLYSAEKIEVDGEPCVLSVILDISQRRYMEQALKANEELLRLFVNHTPAAIAMFDNEMRYLQVSDRFLTDYHLEGQDIIGKYHYDLFPNLPQRWKEVHRRILAGAMERNDEDPYQEADGSLSWLQWESLPWRKADGEIGGLILFTQVITERKRAEAALRASEERFSKIFNLSPYRMGILRVSDAVILDVNDCWVRETGYSREETVNRSLFRRHAWFTDETHSQVVEFLKEGKPFGPFECTIITKAGKPHFVQVSAALVDIDGAPHYLWASNDITERKQGEDEKRLLIHDLNERVKELTALHETARILQDETKSLPQLLNEILSLLPAAWQYPEVTAARIRFGDLEFKTPGFKRSPWSQLSEFQAGDIKGEIEVIYTEERPPEQIGPFVAEELNLINSIAEMISSALNRRYAQKALQESEEVFRSLTETVSAGIYIYRDQKFIYVNPTAEQLTGYSRDELLGMDLLNLVHPSYRDPVKEDLIKRELGWQAPNRTEGKILTKSGEERWMDVSAVGTKFRGEGAVIVTTFDITARKRAEEDLQRSEGRYRTLFETSPDSIAVYDADLKLVMNNERALLLFGFPPGANLAGSLAFDFVAPEDRKRVATIIDGIRQTERLEVFECTGLRKDGTRFDMEMRAALLRDVPNQPPFILSLTTDITSRKTDENALKASQDQLRALSAKMQSTREEEGTRIAREIHDELGGSLTGLKWDLEGIDTKLSGANGNAAIAEVRKQISSMTVLIESTINTVRRISSELRPGVLDDLGLVAAIEWQAQQFQRRTGLKVHWETDLDTVDVSHDVATAVFRIFQEVLTNVLRHSRARNIYVKLLQRSEQLELEVVDDGRGITEDEKRNTSSLGLLGMEERALLVGGEVYIKGAPGKGTTVVVRIPLTEESGSQLIA